nr:unnamed protein product [Callosobruchus chinensis]
MVCDAKLKILNVVAWWPGRTHDSTIFNNRWKQHFENQRFSNSILFRYGDNGYLLTPLLAPNTAEGRRYNSSHIKTRNPIERLFGVVKRRFPILMYGCRLKVETFLNIIVAAAVLHNRALTDGDELVVPLPDELDDHKFNRLLAQDEDRSRILDLPSLPPTSTRTTIINECFRNHCNN